jgi:hypothetical protein
VKFSGGHPQPIIFSSKFFKVRIAAGRTHTMRDLTFMCTIPYVGVS